MKTILIIVMLLLPFSIYSQTDSIIVCPIPKIAEFPGGTDQLLIFVKEHLIDPIPDDSIHSLTKAKFIVDEFGKIKNIQIINSIGKAYDNEVIRVLKLMPDWIPVEYDGKKQKSNFILPIKF